MLQAVGMGAAFLGCSDWITARNEHNNQRWDAAAIAFFCARNHSSNSSPDSENICSIPSLALPTEEQRAA